VAPASRGPGAVDPSAPLDPADTAASAAIDGLAPDPDAPAIDPDLLDERVRELTGVTALLAEPVRPPETGVIDAHIAAALATLPAAEPEGPPVEHRPGPAVASLAEHRRRRPSAGRWLAVAAAIAVVALAIPVVRSLSDSSTPSHDTAASATSDTTKADGAASSAAGPELSTTQSTVGFNATANTTSNPAPDTSALSPAADLGTVDTPQALTARVAGAVPAESPPATTGGQLDGQASTTTALPSTRSLSCDTSNRASHPDLGALRYTATATYQATPVEVAVYDVADSTAATARVIVTRIGDCEVLLDQLLP
jgi:cytoskeletal protein RodZ